MLRKQIARAPIELNSEEPGHIVTRAEGQALFEMAHLRPERIGSPFVVFISQRGSTRHEVRVKVAHGARVRPSVTVAVRPAVRVIRGKLDVSDLALLRRWIELNQDVLVQYWHGVIEYTEDAIGALRPIDASAL